MTSKIEYIDYGETALTLNAKLTWAKAEEAARTLGTMEGAIQWWIGDFLNLSESTFGERYAQLVPEGTAKETWRKYKWVCAQVPVIVRRRTLSFSHHDAVAKLEPKDQEVWLTLAVTKEMSVKKLRDAMRLSEKGDDNGDNGGDGDDGDGRLFVMATCPECQYSFQVKKKKD